MVEIQITKFIDIDIHGKESREYSYGYRIYNDECSEYNNFYYSIDELYAILNKENIINFLKHNHSEFYEVIKSDGKLIFNGEIISID
ncbi:hypothetical protein [Clostridium sp.]|uniref:hypothetical protein n=1 Tax=Clostridium sp. TaxID=1506 RepID=UPI0026DCCCC6|nr:hypothetical protein [Clostridium sp.]MDO5040336.1 hypothetical protein [Clostridium sp.]